MEKSVSALVLAACLGQPLAGFAQPNEAQAWRNQARQLMDEAVAAQPAPGVRLQIDIGELDPRLQLAPCQQVQAYLPPQAKAWGRTRVGLRCTQGEKAWNVYLPVVVKAYAPTPVLRQALAAGTVLDDSHFVPGQADWAATLEPPLASPQQLRGRVLAQALPAGSAVHAPALKARLWFAAGDTVQVVARGGGFEVSGSGQAMGPGIDGQRVRVRTDSGQLLSGLAVGVNRVELKL